jgi:hypothetical protein
MVMLDSARRKVPVLGLARWLLGLGIAATLAANVAYGLGRRLTGAVVAAWSALALVGSYELLMMVIRSAQVPATAAAVPETSDGADDGLLRAPAAEVFTGEVAAGRVPSVRAIRAPAACRAIIGTEGTRTPGRHHHRIDPRAPPTEPATTARK